MHHGLQHRLTEAIRNHRAFRHDVLLKGVRKDVRNSGRGLVRGDRERVFGVEDRGHRVAAADRELLLRFLIRDHTAAVVLRPRRRKRNHVKDREVTADTVVMDHEIPGVAVVQRAAGDRFRAVEGGTAADRNDELNPFLLADLNTRANRLDLRVRGNAGKLKDVAAGIRQNLLHGVVEPDTLDESAAVGEEHLLPVALDEVTEFRNTALPENEMSRKIQIVRLNHDYSSQMPAVFRQTTNGREPAVKQKMIGFHPLSEPSVTVERLKK